MMSFADPPHQIARNGASLEIVTERGTYEFSTDKFSAQLIENIYSGPFRRHYFDMKEFLDSNQYREYNRLYVGAYHITDSSRRRKLIAQEKPPFGDPELAYQYLDFIFQAQKRPKQKRVLWPKEVFSLLDIYRPEYLTPLEYGEFGYLDIDYAHWQIMRDVGLDVSFNPARSAFSPGVIRFLEPDWVRENSQLRHNLSGLIRKKTQNQVIKGVMKTNQFFKNNHLSPSLWGWINYVLFYAAHEMVQRFDIKYWICDGMMLPVSQVEAAQDYLYTEWGLEASFRGFFPYNRKPGWKEHAARNWLPKIPYDPVMAQRMKRWRRLV
jgi:hypothetical protein